VAYARCPAAITAFPWKPIGRNARDIELFVEWFRLQPGRGDPRRDANRWRIDGDRTALGRGRARAPMADLLLVDGKPDETIALLTNASQSACHRRAGRLHKS